MKNIKFIIFILLFASWEPVEAIPCDRDENLSIFFLQFSTETFIPISFKEMKKRNDNLIIKTDDFVRLILESKPSKEIDFFENIRMRIKTKKGVYYVNKDGVILFRDRILGQIDKKILNSLDFGYGLYNPKSCFPYNIEVFNYLKQFHNKEVLSYLDRVGELADWRNKNFVGYEVPETTQ